MQGTSKWIILSMLGETMLLVLVSLYTYSTNSLEEIKGLLPLVNFLSIAILLIVLFSIKKLEEMVKKEAEMMAVKDNLSQTESLLKTLQSQRHEYNRHLQTLQAMIHLGATQDAIEYLDGISLQNFPSEDMVYVGDPILTALLNSKGKVAESKNIKFDFAIKCDLGGLPFSSWELSSVLGNLLDNAFEAVLLNDWKHRSVGLEIKEEQGIYIIYVCNNGPTIPKEEEERVFKAGYTTKGSQGRGYGLFLVRNIIESYGGRIQMISNRRTLFKCYIPGKEGFYGQGIFKRLAAGLGSRLQSDIDQIEVYAYGLELVLYAIIKVVVILGSAFILGILESTLYYLCSFILLRFFGGGVHLSTYGRCLAVGLISAVIVVKFVDGLFIQGFMIHMAMALLFLQGIITIFLWVPATTHKRSITIRRERWKQKGLTLSALILLLAGVWFLYQQRDYYNGMTIVFGGLVSFFLMSPLGFQCIHTIERILDRREGER